MRRFKVGLSLGGGGVRGFAHLGAIKVLRNASIPIDLVVGTSMGAIFGAAFCLDGNLEDLEAKALKLVKHKEILDLESFLTKPLYDEKKLIMKKLMIKVKDLYLWNLKAAKKWLVKSSPIVNLLRELLDERKFSDVKIPFACVATDLKNGEEVVLREGRILEAALASSSIPGIFPPVKRNNRLLVDGGVVDMVPGKVAKSLGADFVIGINVEASFFRQSFNSGLDIIFQVDQIRAHHLNRQNVGYCDFLFEPRLSEFGWSEFSKAQICIEEGKRTALDRLCDLKRAISKMRRLSILRRLF